MSLKTLDGMNRRQALKRTFVFSAAFLTPGLVTRLFSEPAAPVFTDGAMHLLAVADYGTNDEHQIAVCRQMEHYASQLPAKPTAVLALGDNFYGEMSADRFQTGFEDMYRKEHLDCPFFVCLGNHDYEPTKAPMELLYAKDNPGSRWKLPAKWYVQELANVGKPLLRIIVLDSNYQGPLTSEEMRAEVQFLGEQLKTPTKAPWTIVVAHHPLFSNGPHKDSQALIDNWGPLLREAKVPLYLAGHDHLMQHLEIDGYEHTSFVVTGGGGQSLHKNEGPHKAYAKETFGFTHLQITPETLTIRLLNDQGQCIHALSKDHSGKMTLLPVA